MLYFRVEQSKDPQQGRLQVLEMLNIVLQDNELIDKKFQKELNSGTAALVLLAVLDQAGEPMYGYQIAKHLDTGSDLVPVKQGALYPVLRSLEAGGLLESRVEPSVSGPPRRYYQITSDGRETLRKWIEIWTRTTAFVDTTLKGTRHDD